MTPSKYIKIHENTAVMQTHLLGSSLRNLCFAFASFRLILLRCLLSQMDEAPAHELFKEDGMILKIPIIKCYPIVNFMQRNRAMRIPCQWSSRCLFSKAFISLRYFLPSSLRFHSFNFSCTTPPMLHVKDFACVRPVYVTSVQDIS